MIKNKCRQPALLQQMEKREKNRTGCVGTIDECISKDKLFNR